MATDRHARGIGQQRLEEAPAPAVPTPDSPVPPTPAPPTVPSDGSSAELLRRQAKWDAERRRFEASRVEPDAPDDPSPPG